LCFDSESLIIKQDPIYLSTTMSTGKTCSELAETYYDSEDGYKYYSVLYSEDYSGAGVYPSEHLETDIDDFLGPKYLRGDGLTIR